MNTPEILFLFFEKANFSTVEPLLREIELQRPERAAFVKGFDFKEESGEIPKWELPMDLRVIELPQPSSSCLAKWFEWGRQVVPVLKDSGDRVPLEALLAQNYIPQLRQRWAEVGAATETLLKQLKPPLIVLPEDTDYIRGRLAGRIAKGLGITTVVLSAHFYDRWLRYPMVGERYGDYFLVLNELSKARLLAQGILADRIHVIGNAALTTTPVSETAPPRLLLCEQGRPGEKAWVEDVVEWFSNHPHAKLWIRPHPHSKRTLVYRLLPPNAELAPPLSLDALFPQVRGVIGETTSVLWQASAAGLATIIVHYGFGPIEIALPPSAKSSLARTQCQLGELLSQAIRGDLAAIPKQEMTSSVDDPTKKALLILNNLLASVKSCQARSPGVYVLDC